MHNVYANTYYFGSKMYFAIVSLCDSVVVDVQEVNTPITQSYKNRGKYFSLLQVTKNCLFAVQYSL